MPHPSNKRRRSLIHRKGLIHRKALWWPIGVVAGVLIVVFVAVNATPWPGAMLIRAVFSKNAADVKVQMEPFAPSGVTRVANLPYRSGDDAAVLDVYYPRATKPGTALPTVFWVHGGAWISGNKDDDIPYFKILASKGYTVVAPNYSVGPERTYPTAVVELNTALRYIQKNAARLHVDSTRIVLAGDSAGSQLSSQLATLVTSPSYADRMHLAPALTPNQLKGVVLTCGVYNMKALNGLPGIVGWGFDTATWAYGGIRDYAKDPAMKQMSTINYVTGDFPPAFITGGNADGLTAIQSKPFAKKLQGLGVDTTTLFFPKNYKPGLPHEYQFMLKTAGAQKALKQILAFLDARMGNS